jgi:hypothetical protein
LSFRRLTAGHVLAFVAALALLLAMAPDWYSDKTAERIRDDQGKVSPQLNREVKPSLTEQASFDAEEREKNAWQAPGAIDKVILLLLIATAGLAIVAAFLRAAGRSVGPPSPSAIASLTGLVAAALIAYRIIDPPGFNEAAVVQWGAPVGLVCVGLAAFGSRMAVRTEREGSAQGPAAGEPEAPDAPATPAGAT